MPRQQRIGRQTTLRVPDEHLDWCDEEAARLSELCGTRVDRSDVMRKAIAEAHARRQEKANG